jgi:hypothetical protein
VNSSSPVTMPAQECRTKRRFKVRWLVMVTGQKKKVAPRLKLRGMAGDTTLALIAPS